MGKKGIQSFECPSVTEWIVVMFLTSKGHCCLITSKCLPGLLVTFHKASVLNYRKHLQEIQG